MPQGTLIMRYRSFIPSCALFKLSYPSVPFSLVLMDGPHWWENSVYSFLFTSYMLHLLTKKLFLFSFHLNTSVSNSASDWLLSFLVLFESDKYGTFSFLDCFSEVDARGLFSLDVVNEGFNGVLIFPTVTRTILGKDGVYEIGDVDLKAWFF